MKRADPTSVSISSHAARGSRSRGWPTEPGLSSCLPASSSSCSASALPPSRTLLAERQRELHVAVPDECEVGRLRAQRGVGDVCASARTPRSGRGSSRGRARRPRASPVGESRASASSSSGVSTLRVQRAATPASEVNWSMSSTPETTRSWLPPRQIAARSLHERQAFARPAAVADDVAEAPELVDHRLARHAASTASSACRLPWTSDMTATRNACGYAASGSSSPSYSGSSLMPWRVDHFE